MDTKCVILKRMWSVVLAAAGLFTAPLSATLQAQEASQTAQADDVSLSEDGDITVGTAGHYYVNMPVTGTNTLTITADDITDGKGTFKVYDDGGKGGNYSDGCNGTLVLTAPTGYVLQLAGDIYTETVRDKLNIYNNSNTSGTPLLINVSSSSSGTKTDITTVTSLSNVMTIYFSSDNSGNYAGLDLTVIISKDEYTYSESTYCDLKNEMIVGGDIILKKGTYYKYDDGDGDTFVIYSGEIDGNGSVIDMANSGYRAFEIKGSGVTIKNLTIKNANFNGKGGAIYFDEQGTVENCTFIDNEASEGGGAVYFKDRGTVMNCNFTGNKATGDDCYGGAVYFHDNGTVKKCIFTGNSACGAGAVLIKGNGSVTNCDFINNTATTTGGGAIWFGSNGTVKDCNFTGNEASKDGGGVYFDSQSTVTNCNFVNNSAKEGGSIYASNGIVLDWTNATDFIFASSYGVGDGKVIKTADGKRFVAYTVDNTNPESPVETPVAIIAGTVSDLSTIGGKTLRPIAVAEPDGQGGTTVSPGYLLSIVPSDITPADKTDSQGQPAPDFTITTGTGDNQVTTPYYIYKAGSNGTTIPLSVPAYGQQGADFTVSIDGAAESALPDAAVTTASGKATAALPWTGANDVEIRDARYYNTGVAYRDWDGTKLVDKTTDANIKVYTLMPFLNSSNITLGKAGETSWYVFSNTSHLIYYGSIALVGDVHLVFNGGSSMDINPLPTTAEFGINMQGHDLFIHGQSEAAGGGELRVLSTTRSSTGFFSETGGNVTINGCQVRMYSFENDGIEAIHGIKVGGDVSINGSEVEIYTRTGYGVYAQNVILNSSVVKIESRDLDDFYAMGDVTINGGDVTIPLIKASTIAINGGKINVHSINAAYDITLSWMNTNDYFNFHNFGGTVKIADGKRFVVSKYRLFFDKVDVAVIEGGTTLTDAQKAFLAHSTYLEPAPEDLPAVTYIDANGETKDIATDDDDNNNFVYLLQGDETTLGEDNTDTWYISNTTGDDLAYNSQILLKGDVHLILAANSKMTVENNADDESAVTGTNLTIYGQAAGAGSFSATANGVGGIGFDISNSLIINGGKVDAEGTGYGIWSNNIILGWTNPDDYIKANSYGVISDGIVKIAAGKYFSDGTNFYGSADGDYVFGAADNATIGDIAGKTLRPAKVINLGASQADFVAVTGTGGTWMVDDSKATLFVVYGIDTESGELKLQAVEKVGDEYVIPDGATVILGGPTTEATPTAENVGNFEGPIFLNPASTTSADASTPSEAAQGALNLENASPDPMFFAGDGTTTLGDLIDAANAKLAAAGKPTLDKNDIIVFMPAVTTGTDGVAHLSFRAVNIGLDAVLAKDAMVLIVSKMTILQMVRNGMTPPASGARKHGIYLNLGADNATTGILQLPADGDASAQEYFGLDGRPVGSRPQRKGVYIRRGSKLIVR